MDRRRFLRNGAEYGMGVTLSTALLTDQAAATHFAQSTADPFSSPLPPNQTRAHPLSQRLLSLDGTWELATDPQNIGRTKRWFAGSLTKAKPSQVPGTIQEVFPHYHGVVWYARDFEAPANPDPHGPSLLRFWAVDYLADVWLNGIHVGSHEGADTPFLLDVSRAIKPQQKNRLVVRVLNPGLEPIDGFVLKETPHRNKAVPFSPGNSFNSGGVVDSCELLLTPRVRIEDLFLRPDPRSGLIRVQATLRSTAPGTTRARMEVLVTAATGGVISVGNMEREVGSETLQWSWR